MVISSIMI